jgi:DNA-binding beta-propeller fold protein YncE
MHRMSGFLSAIILTGLVALFLVPSVCAEGGYSFLTTWGTYGLRTGEFVNPHDIAVDSEGNVYVADTRNNRLQKFGPSGTFITQWGALGSGRGQFYWPVGVVIDNSGNVYVADYNHRIQKFDPNGIFMTMWGISSVGKIAVDNSGNVYVADTESNRIQKFGPNGNLITEWGTLGSRNGQFHEPYGVAIGNSGNVYVADYGNRRIQKFDPDGTFITKWGTSGTGNGQFQGPYQVAVDNAGNVYVSDWEYNRIQKFGPKGAFITKWGTTGSGDGQFNGPGGVAVNPSRDVYVAEMEKGNDRVQVFSPDRFADTPLDYWATPYIEVIYQAGYTTGYGGTTDFKPDYEVTREQMAVFILRALNDIPADGYCGSTAPFTDVPADWWSCKYVKRLVELEITSGIGGGLFDPGGVVTREQMAAFLTRALDEVPGDGYCGMEDPFTDVPYSLWSCKYIKRLMELGVTSGIGDGLYGPGNPVTRAQMAVFLARAFLGME